MPIVIVFVVVIVATLLLSGIGKKPPPRVTSRSKNHIKTVDQRSRNEILTRDAPPDWSSQRGKKRPKRGTGRNRQP